MLSTAIWADKNGLAFGRIACISSKKPNIWKNIKANVCKKVLFLQTDFLSWEILIIKKLNFEKTKPTCYSTFETDITKVGLVLLISNFFINKISQGRKSVRRLAAAIYF